MINNISIAKRLAPVQKVGLETISRNSSVIEKNVFQPQLSKPTSFRVTLTATGGAKTFIIGDRTGLIAALNSGTTYTEPTSANISVAALKTFLGKRTLISSMNISASVSAASLANNPQLLAGDIDGTVNTVNIDLSTAVRNDAQNTKLLTVDFSKAPFVLDDNHCMSLYVAVDETITLTFTVAGVDR